MAAPLPADLPPWQPPQPPPKPGWMKALVGALIALGVIVLLAVGVGGYFAYKALNRFTNTMTGAQQAAPATPPAQAAFTEAVRFVAPVGVAALASGDLQKSGSADVVAQAGADIVVIDQAGKQVGRFASGVPAPPVMPRMGGLSAGMYGVRLRTGTLRQQPAVVLARTSGDAVVAHAADGRELLRSSVSGTRVTALEVADLNADGESEILVGRDSQLGLTCLNSRGATEWQFGVNTEPGVIVVADATGDSRPEVYVGEQWGAGGAIAILDSRGKQVGQWPARRMEVAVAAADANGDRKAEFLAVVPDFPSPPGGSSSGGMNSAFRMNLLGLSSAGKEEWRTSLGGGLSSMYGAPLAAGDLDGDGKSEWIVAGPDGTVRVYNKDGIELCRQAMGQYIDALTVTPPDKPGGCARAWLAMGSQIEGLDWQKWMTKPAVAPAAQKAAPGS